MSRKNQTPAKQETGIASKGAQYTPYKYVLCTFLPDIVEISAPVHILTSYAALTETHYNEIL